MKMWKGRFTKDTHEEVNAFNASISFDQRLYSQDIKGSIAHVKMLGKQGIIPPSEADIIAKTLEQILEDVKNRKIEFDIDAEDIHMNIEKILIQRIGDVGKKVHTGRSRNDQVALDLRLYITDEIHQLFELITGLLSVLIIISEDHIDTYLPGYTHLQKAQPTTLAHHFMAYFEMFKRDCGRLEDNLKRTKVMPLGSGALASTTYPLDRQFVADSLDFEAITLNSIDAVSDRDFVLETLFCSSVIMMHMSRLCEELILWNTDEFQYIQLDDGFCTGSSIMPQKKNPDIPELIRGKTGRVYGDLMALLTTMKGLPLAYNKDMQEDKEALFDAMDTTKSCISVLTKLLETTTFNKENMLKGLKSGFCNATDAADYLVKKGVSFRDAHEIIGKTVLYCIENDKNIEDLKVKELSQLSPYFENDLYDYITLEACINDRDVIGGPSIVTMKDIINNHKNMLHQ